MNPLERFEEYQKAEEADRLTMGRVREEAQRFLAERWKSTRNAEQQPSTLPCKPRSPVEAYQAIGQTPECPHGPIVGQCRQEPSALEPTIPASSEHKATGKDRSAVTRA